MTYIFFRTFCGGGGPCGEVEPLVNTLSCVNFRHILHLGTLAAQSASQSLNQGGRKAAGYARAAQNQSYALGNRI